MSENNEYTLSDKQKMLGMALYARGVDKANMAAILMVLQNDEQVDDLTWYMSQNPKADARQLVAVAYQIVKEANE